MTTERPTGEGPKVPDKPHTQSPMTIKRLAEAARGRSDVAADLYRAIKRGPKLVVVLFYFVGDGKTHRYRAADLAEQGWRFLVPLCQKAVSDPVHHVRELLTARSSVDVESQADEKCASCLRWVPEREHQQVSLVDYVPPPGLAVYRASCGEVATWGFDTVSTHSCRFCLAVYAEITHTEQCELTHLELGR